MGSRRRIDQYLVTEGVALDVSAARALIEDDRVTVNGAPVLNPARQVGPSDQVVVVPAERFVSRGGIKLDAALDHFERMGGGIQIAGSRVLDVGASTGGFVDCVLQRGAASVVACDVGHGLLHPRIANDPRVEVRDGVNARTIGELVATGKWQADFDVIIVDVSFISLRTILSDVCSALRSGGELLALVKPQFEATKHEVDLGGGVIEDEGVRKRCIAEVSAAISQCGLTVVGGVDCAIHGPAGNREHWLRAVASQPLSSHSIA